MNANEFENEVLVRLSVIEEKIDSLESAKKQTYDNNSQIALMEKRITDIEQRNKSLSAAVISIITGVAVAAIVYFFKL